MHGRCFTCLLLVFVLAAPAAAKPWRLGEALDLSESLSLTVEHRQRFESLDSQFRRGRDGRVRALAVRTLVHARWQATDFLAFGGELLDARAWPGEKDTPLDTGIVNALELLQGYAELSGEVARGRTTARVGRITMDVGSRRLVARNRFRNTINAFTGVDAEWRGERGRSVRIFYTLPVQRRPTAASDLRDNQAEYDRESFDLDFWGVHLGADLPCGDHAELYLFGLHEDDRPGRPSRDRQLYTPGFRLRRAPQAGAFDYEIESVLQLGRSRSSTSSARDLDHLAHFHHGELGFSFGAPLSPRVALQYDYASGDEDPSDGDNERFDTLFGARRFDFGPTGFYGPFVRANVHTPGLRVQAKPGKRVSAFAAYRLYWLASDEDAWVVAGVNDPSGDSGTFLGSQLELRVRWDVVPGNLRLEGGFAHLFEERFANDAPNSNGQGDPTFFYTQAVLSF